MWTKVSVLVVTSVVMMSLSVASTPSDSTPSEVKAARAVVSGPLARLYEFHQNLIVHVGSDFDKAGIKCAGCEKFPPTASLTESTQVTYTFYRDGEHKFLMDFIESWDELQTAKVDKLVTITFDMNYPNHACVPPFQSPCKSAPFCNLTPGCDPDGRPPCTACRR
jgi:hypothetical protein